MLLHTQFFYPFVVSLICVVSALSLSYGIMKRAVPDKTHYSFIALIMSLASGYFFRNLVWLYDESIFYYLSYVGFLLVPVFTTLFVENVSREPSSKSYKIFILAVMSAIFWGIFFTESFIKSEFWMFFFLIYYATSFSYLSIKIYLYTKRTVSRREKSILLSLMVTILIGLTLSIFEWISVVGLSDFRLSNISFLVLLYLFSSVFFSFGDFQVRKNIIKLILYSAFPILVCIIGFSVLGNLSELMKVSTTAYVCIVPINIILLIFGLNGEGNALLLTKRLNSLGAGNSFENLKKINNWDEVEKIHVFSDDFLKDKNIDLKTISRIYTLNDIEELLYEVELSFSERNKLEKINYLLRYSDCHYLCPIGNSGSILVVRFTCLMNSLFFKEMTTLLAKYLYLGMMNEKRLREKSHV